MYGIYWLLLPLFIVDMADMLFGIEKSMNLFAMYCFYAIVIVLTFSIKEVMDYEY